MTQRIDILTTGIMSSRKKSSRSTGDEIVSAIQGLFPNVGFNVKQICSIDSSQMTTDILWKIGVEVKKSFQNDASGVVVAHDTDTLEETAYFLDLVGDFSNSAGKDISESDDEGLGPNNQDSQKDDSSGPTVNVSPGLSMESSFGAAKGRITGVSSKVTYGPTVVTGAMRKEGAICPEGLANLVASCKVALEPVSVNYGVLVVMNDEIHLAREVTKANSWLLDAFKSPVSGPVGLVGEDGATFVANPLDRSYEKYTALVPPVDLIKVSLGSGDRSIPALVRARCRGLVVESLGYGNLPPGMVEDLQSAVEHNVPVVITTRCFSGGTPNPGTVTDSGFVTTDLPGPKARIKLMLALSITNNPSEIARLFAQYP